MSPNTVNLAVGELVRGGAVERIEPGRSHPIRLKSGTPQGDALRTLFGSESLVVKRLKDTIATRVDADASCILFGSAARDEMGARSDIDLLIIARTRHRAAMLNVEIVEAALRVHPGPYRAIHLTPSELRQRWNSPLLQSIRREGVVLGGKPLETYR